MRRIYTKKILSHTPIRAGQPDTEDVAGPTNRHIHIMKRIATSILAIAGVITAATPMAAEEAPAAAPADDQPTLFRLDATTRIDWQYDRPFDKTNDAETGFKGKYLMVRIDGQIVNGLTYSWRQRLNKGVDNSTFFDNTDWLYVNYATDGWNFQAGKQVVAIGGWEYDAAPYDLYGTSVFWNNIPCFKLGASVGYDVTKADRITAQVTQSPFFTTSNSNMYGYNIMWTGSHGLFDALWSANLLEYTKGHYISYLSLGNKFTVGKWCLELDLMNRAASHQTFLFKDCSVIGQLSFSPDSRWKIHAKMTYDVNHSGTGADFTVFDGTELTMAGAGVEFYPLKKNRTSLRLHANAYYSWGKNSNSGDLMQDNTLFGTVGVTWMINFLNIKKR